VSGILCVKGPASELDDKRYETKPHTYIMRFVLCLSDNVNWLYDIICETDEIFFPFSLI
jgi:hypothetical protein